MATVNQLVRKLKRALKNAEFVPVFTPQPQRNQTLQCAKFVVYV